MKRKYYIAIGSIVVIVIAILIFKPGKSDTQKQLIVKVDRGEFKILVTTTGELQAKSSVDVMGPAELRNSRSIRIREIKIQDLVPEGTVVDSGEYICKLDRSEIGISLKDLEESLETIEAKFLKAQIDTTMQLRELRDNLVNLKYTMEEKQIVLEQSKYEPPATIRQTKIDLEKAQRSYDQAKNNYSLKVQQAQGSLREASIDLEKSHRKVNDLKDVIEKFTIYAPQSGMVIYKKGGDGQKRKAGSMISPWDLSVATLPDLSQMNSKTYVNEIDISKVKVGQKVLVGIDAFPDKKYTGKVVEVANIGEQLSNTDAKVFEVVISVDQSEDIMRPSMTTSNQIITDYYEDVLFLPLEAIHNEDSISFVYTKSNKKQIIVPGEANENYIVIEQGVYEAEEVYLSVPDNLEKYKLSGNELITVLKERERLKREEGNKNQKEINRSEFKSQKQNRQSRPSSASSKSE